MRKSVLGALAIGVAMLVPVGREATACNECASAYGIVGCRYRFFYGAQNCNAYAIPGGFRCSVSGACDEVGPPEPGDRGTPREQEGEPGLWTDARPAVQLPEGSFALLPNMALGGSLRGFWPR